MASGSFGLTKTGNTSSLVSLSANWSSSSNGSSKNSSTVNVAVYASKSASSTSNTWGTTNTTVAVSGGGSKSEDGLSVNIPPGGKVLLFSKNYTVPHNDDGSKKTTISVSIGGDVIWGSGSKEVTLDTIPRAATLNSAPNFSDEANPTITYSNPAGTAATVQACIADNNGNVQFAKYRNIPATGTSYTFELTDEERQALIDAVPDGSKEMYVKFYLKTIIGGTTITPLKNLTRIFSVVGTEPEILPVVKDIGSYSVGTLTKDETVMIDGFNHMHATMDVTLKKGATIVKQTIQNGATVVEGSAAEFPSSEDGRFIFTVIDTYGNTISKEHNVTVIPYIKLTCNIKTNNPTADGDMSFMISGNYFDDKFGENGVNNTLTVEWRYKKDNEEYGEWIPITPNIAENGYTAIVNLTGLEYKSAYTFQARAMDLIDTGGVLSPERVAKSIPVFNWGENNFDITVPLQVDNIHCSEIFNGELELGSYDSKTGLETEHETQFRNAERFEVNCNTTYRITLNGHGNRMVILFYDFEGVFLSETRDVKDDGIFTTPADAKYVNFRCYQDDWTVDYASLIIKVSKATPLNIVDLIYPVGSIYMSVNNLNPAIMFGGSWEQIKGRFLLGVGSNEANNTSAFGTLEAEYTTINPGDMGGKYVHTLSTDEMPSHGHGVKLNVPYGMPYNDKSGASANNGGNVHYGESYNPISIQSTGGSKPHTNMPPYLGVYIWKRVS